LVLDDNIKKLDVIKFISLTEYNYRSIVFGVTNCKETRNYKLQHILYFEIAMGLDNENPTLFEKSEERTVSEKDLDDNEAEEFDSREIFGKLVSAIIK